MDTALRVVKKEPLPAQGPAPRCEVCGGWFYQDDEDLVCAFCGRVSERYRAQKALRRPYVVPEVPEYLEEPSAPLSPPETAPERVSQNMAKRAVYRPLEVHNRERPSTAQLRLWFVECGMTTGDIAEMLGRSQSTVQHWIKRDGLRRVE